MRRSGAGTRLLGLSKYFTQSRRQGWRVRRGQAVMERQLGEEGVRSMPGGSR